MRNLRSRERSLGTNEKFERFMKDVRRGENITEKNGTLKK
jgi:hypothetical protein